MWKPHHVTGVNIFFENGQRPHNSSYEALCVPLREIRLLDDGILVVESWLISATEYIAIDNSPLQPRVHVDGRSGLPEYINHVSLA